MTIKSRAILITGCSTGIGRCLARGLRERGYRVLATARSDTDVQHLHCEGFESFQVDLSDPASVQRGADWALSVCGGTLFALINNGAYGQPGAVEDLSRDVLRQQFEVNVFGTHDLTTRLIPVLRMQPDARIIQISSILGLVSLSFRGAYNASKYALESLSDTLRLELRGTSVKIVLIEPGPVESRFRRNSLAVFLANINTSDSHHADLYNRVEERLTKLENARFTLPASAVLKKTIHALESNKPRIRYKVTFPAHALSILKRLLPDRWLDRILSRASETPGNRT